MIKKVSFTILIALFLFTFFSTGTLVQATSISNIIEGAQNFVNEGKEGSNNTVDVNILNDTSSLIYNTLLIVGTCAAVIIAAILGIQFITGSVEQKVKVKESLLPFIVGCIVIFGAFGIWRLVIILIR